jgi:Cu/Ag efflux protein CusF
MKRPALEFNWKICYGRRIVKKIYILLVASALLIGCSSAPTTESKDTAATSASGAAGASGPVAIKTYPMHGKIVTVTPAEKSARIDAGPIGDWMGAMTMNYTIKDDAGLAKLKPGMTFDATVYVQGDDFWVADIKPAQ